MPDCPVPDTLISHVSGIVYSNSLLATLNTRRVIRGRGTDRSPGNNGDFTIIQTGITNGQIQTTHSIFGQVDWQKVLLSSHFNYSLPI